MKSSVVPTPTTVCLPLSKLNGQSALTVVQQKLTLDGSTCHVPLAPSASAAALGSKFAFVHFEEEENAQTFVSAHVEELRCFIVVEDRCASTLKWVNVAPKHRRITLELDHAEGDPPALIGYALRGAGFVVRVGLCREEGRAYVDFLVNESQGKRKKTAAELEQIRLAFKRSSAADVNGYKRTGWRNGQGQRSSKGDKATTFRKWLVERYSAETLNAGTGVLDVAGGNGELAFKLLNFSGIQTTIVDPRPYNLLRMLKLVTKDHIYRLYQRCDNDCENPRIQLPLPGHIRCWFTSPAVSQELLESSATTYANASETLQSLPSEQDVLQQALRTCSIIIGMHPDQATEPILDNALLLSKPFAVVPCCVFPKLFVARAHIKTHAQFCKYLEDKAKSARLRTNSYIVRTTSLDFNGRNTVIYIDNNARHDNGCTNNAEQQRVMG